MSSTTSSDHRNNNNVGNNHITKANSFRRRYFGKTTTEDPPQSQQQRSSCPGGGVTMSLRSFRTSSDLSSPTSTPRRKYLLVDRNSNHTSFGGVGSGYRTSPTPPTPPVSPHRISFRNAMSKSSGSTGTGTTTTTGVQQLSTSWEFIRYVDFTRELIDEALI